VIIGTVVVDAATARRIADILTRVAKADLDVELAEFVVSLTHAVVTSGHADAPVGVVVESEWCTVSEVAAREHVSAAAIRKRARRQQVPARKENGRWLIATP
jgi:hypothetical protein